METKLWQARHDEERQPAFQVLGKKFNGKTTPSQAVKKLGADYNVALYPQYIDLSGQQILSDKFAIVRDPIPGDEQYKVFGHASQNYEIVQNRDIAALADGLANRWPLDSMGIHNSGKTFFLSLKSGSSDIGGEQIDNYFMIWDKKDGGTSLKVLFTPVRIICANVLNMSLRRASISVSLNHADNVAQNLDWRVKLFEQLVNAENLGVSALRQMAGVILSDSMVEDVIRTAYPIPATPKKVQSIEGLDLTADELSPAVQEFLGHVNSTKQNHQYIVNVQESRRQMARETLTKMNDSNGALANSAYYTWNAVVEVEDFRAGNAADGSDALASALFGERAKIKRTAFDAAYKNTLKSL